MSLNDALKPHYEAVVKDLEIESAEIKQQIAPLNARLKELNLSINILSRKLNPDGMHSLPSSPRPTNAYQKYARMSVRWAILDLLNDAQPMTTSEIAEALRLAGIQTKASNFTNNVSAVLSATMKEHNEVHQLPDSRWELTERGRDAIAHIRTTVKFKRSLPWSA